MDSDWLSAFAAVGTVGAFLVGFLLLRREQRREADRAEDERRAQAERISAWIELTRKIDGGRELAFHVHNASAMPIYDVELPLPARGDEEASSEFVGLVVLRHDLLAVAWVVLGEDGVAGRAGVDDPDDITLDVSEYA
ncbi:hypothetical protein, partial [Paractinoplanes hotanensis]